MRSVLALAALAALAGCSTSPAGGGGDGSVRADGSVGDALPYADVLPPDAFRVQFVDPDHGPFSGGSEVTVRGNGFDAGIEVRFGGRQVDPLDVQVIDDRRLVVRTPPGEPGLADVEIRLGAETASLPEAFTYEPIIVDPPSGSVAGGTFVTITGLGTSFDASTQVLVKGAPATGVTILNEQSLTAFTPPGVAGGADVRVIAGGEHSVARRAFTYQSTVDAFAGGMGGGPIDGTVNVAVLDQLSKDGVPGAYVALGDPATTPHQGYTDAFGQITFSDPELAGPITAIAAADEYESAAFIGYDATDLTIFLYRPPPPADGPFPPAPLGGAIRGHVMFGNATTLGSPHWHLVPEPRTATERKRIYVTTTASSMFSSPAPPLGAPLGTIDYAHDPDKTAWEFQVSVRPSATAVIAVAGLYDPAKDPSGQGVTGFEPFAMGAARGVLVGPGDVVTGVDIVVDIPLDTAVKVELDGPPALGTPGWVGPTYQVVRPFIDLGGEGVVALNKHGLRAPPAPEARPNEFLVPDGQRSVLLGAMPPLSGSLADGSYAFFIASYSPGGASPFSIRIARGYPDVSMPVTVGDFVGVPRPTDPAPGQTASGLVLRHEAEGDATAVPTFIQHQLRAADGTRLWRILARGDLLDIDLPDLTVVGFPPMPAEVDVTWVMYRVAMAGGVSFDQFTYRHLSALYWSAYAADAWLVRFPGP